MFLSSSLMRQERIYDQDDKYIERDCKTISVAVPYGAYAWHLYNIKQDPSRNFEPYR